MRDNPLKNERYMGWALIRVGMGISVIPSVSLYLLGWIAFTVGILISFGLSLLPVAMRGWSRVWFRIFVTLLAATTIVLAMMERYTELSNGALLVALAASLTLLPAIFSVFASDYDQE